MEKCEVCDKIPAMLVFGNISDLAVGKDSSYLCLECVTMIKKAIDKVKLNQNGGKYGN